MGDGFRGCLDLWIIGMDRDHELGGCSDLLWMFFHGCMKNWTQCWRWGSVHSCGSCSMEHEGCGANWFSPPLISINRFCMWMQNLDQGLDTRNVLVSLVVSVVLTNHIWVAFGYNSPGGEQKVEDTLPRMQSENSSSPDIYFVFINFFWKLSALTYRYMFIEITEMCLSHVSSC